jgi:HEAT repeat protein
VTNKHKLLLVCGAGLAVSFVVISLFAPRSERFNGRTIAEWIDLLPNTVKLEQAGESPIKILGEVGIAAVPKLISALRKGNSPEEVVWIKMAFTPQGQTAQAAVPQLIELLSQPDVQTRDLPNWAANLLAAIGDNAVPKLIAQTHRTNSSERVAAIGVLGEFECAGWTQNHFMIRDYMPGYHAPFQIKPESGKRIARALNDLLLDPDFNVKSAATNALKRFHANNSLKPKNE